ncbi:MAG: alpha/beta fold hydrolase [Ignavibacteriales bacterium]|nr:alpha/beta fold hydrolase [Ignavibacteriales bacterium]
MNLNFQEYGTGKPLVILHGLLGSLDNWHTLSKTFANSFRVLAVDQRNHGKSPHSDLFTYDLMAEDLADLLDHLKIPSTHLLGHSMGGKTAMQFALTNSGRVKSLIVVDMAPREYPRLHDELLDALASVNLTTAALRQQVDDELSKRIPDFAVRQFLMKNLTRDSNGAFTWKANLQAIQKNYAEIAREITSVRPFPGPTLFVKGDRADYVLDSDVPMIKRLFPNAQIAGVNAGHWIHAEAPTVFADIVMSFLRGEPH